jgi:hypothetical protein
MNYCSIEDAWGSANCSSNQYKEYSSENKQIPEIKQLPEKKVYDLNNKINCDEFILHLKECDKCYNKIKNQFRPQLVEKFQNIVDENKDTIVLVLIGISILLFFNLINNITKN